MTTNSGHTQGDPSSCSSPTSAEQSVRRRRSLVALLTLALLTAACTIGSRTVIRDRFDYSAAVADSWKSQMLLNLVRLRYGDTGVFLDVGQIVAGYTVEAAASAGVNFNIFGSSIPNPSIPSNIVSGGVTGRFTDRPTITYTPLMGERFADPEFHELIARMRRVQLSGGIGMRVQRTARDEAVLMTFRKSTDTDVNADALAVRRLLGLDPAASEFRIVYGAVAADDKELALLTRSALEVLIDLSSFIAVPEVHVAERRVNPIIFTLVEPGSKDPPPVLTIPTG